MRIFQPIITGSAEITGSLTVTGSILVTQSYISTVDYIDFTTTADPAHLEGRIHWIDDTKTLNVDTDVNNFAIELGHQNVVRVRNTNSFDLLKGTVVYITGESGNTPTVATASWELDSSSATTIGFVAQQINNNQSGYVITNGLLRGIDTTAFAPGTSLYLSSSGQYTSTIPISPDHEVRLAKTITQAVDGIIYVYVMNGYEIGELHDVLITDKSNGDLITWDSGSNVWKNTKTLSGSYTVSGSLDVNVNGSNLISTDSTNGLLLRNLSEDVVLDVDGGTAYDNVQIDLSIDWYNRKLYRSNNIAPPLGGTYTVDWENGIFSGSLHGTSSWSQNSALLDGANRNTFITTGSSGGSQAITGSLTITQNLTVLGSSSIQYITSSQLVIEDNIISVNTITPAVRYGGIAVIDSGSSPVQSGSLLFDSQNNQWVFVHQSSAGAALTSSVLIMGPQTFNNLGNETTITQNRLTKGTGGDLGEHIGDSNISDNGTVVSINSNTQITGSLVVTQAVTASRFDISSTPTLNNTNTQILTRNSTTGDVEYSTQASAYVFNYGLANAFINQNYLT